jgi:hypothetical protein
MLEEGRTTPRVKALLEDMFRPDDMYSLNAVYLGFTADMAKDVKELNFGFNNDMLYDSCHRGISPFTVMGCPWQRQVSDNGMRTTSQGLAT